uniref:Thiamine biosynthesis protein n=1 Tax=Boldia erythrosiphon TaxID=74908 RepID=A0A1X9PTI3_9RHOD|nr:thiamine biosynthesis protein [Boldia erythrosiphon]ARO90569.1 thiamine biosynthesis protein [Boldia erythrosiphon]
MCNNYLLKEEKIIVKINGATFSCIPNTSLKKILEYLDFDMRLVIVEYNSEIISKEKLDSINMKNQDIIEIVTIVGGG